MRTAFQFTLDKGSKKFFCPNCDKKRFVRYIDITTKEYLPIEFGRCDRADNCGYHLNPYKEGYNKMSKVAFSNNYYSVNTLHKVQSKSEAVYLDFDLFMSTLSESGYQINNFIQTLLKNVAFPFEASDITRLVELYRLGTVCNGNMKGALTIPFIDINEYVRAVQVKQFDKENHATRTDFLHTLLERTLNAENAPLPSWLKAY